MMPAPVAYCIRRFLFTLNSNALQYKKKGEKNGKLFN